jgi:hypothetical protein
LIIGARNQRNGRAFKALENYEKEIKILRKYLNGEQIQLNSLLKLLIFKIKNPKETVENPEEVIQKERKDHPFFTKDFMFLRNLNQKFSSSTFQKSLENHLFQKSLKSDVNNFHRILQITLPSIIAFFESGTKENLEKGNKEIEAFIRWQSLRQQLCRITCKNSLHYSTEIDQCLWNSEIDSFAFENFIQNSKSMEESIKLNWRIGINKMNVQTQKSKSNETRILHNESILEVHFKHFH